MNRITACSLPAANPAYSERRQPTRGRRSRHWQPPTAATVGPSTRHRRCPISRGLTDYVAKFVVDTAYDAIPPEVVQLGKKSILDGLGLALAGSRAESGPLCLKYLDTLGAPQGRSTVIGTSRKTAPQFAALVNGVSIHADDFDDTQLAAAKDRVYGLLVHPTVAVLPAVLALGEQRRISGKDLLLAYHLGVVVECKIGEAIAPRPDAGAFQSTGTCGPF